jgi:hypothetical protein
MGNCSRYTGSGCILVEDAKVLARGEKSFPVIDLTSMSPKSSEGKEIFSFFLLLSFTTTSSSATIRLYGGIMLRLPRKWDGWR